jgi:hypothetical protein
VQLDPPVPAQWGIRSAIDLDFDGTQFAWSGRAKRFYLDALVAHPQLVGPVMERRSVIAVLRLSADANADRPVQLLRTREPQPLSFVAEQVLSVSDDEERARQLAALGPAARRAAFVEADGTGGEHGPVSPGRVQVIERTADSWTLEVSSEGPHDSFVAINQTYDPNWSVTIDGEPAQLRRAEIDMCGVYVPAGKHSVALSHADPWINRGLVLGLLALIGVGVLSTRRPR